MDGDRRVLVATYVALVLLGAMLGIWGAFLVPLRLPGGIEGLAVLIGLLGPAAAGYFGAIGAGSGPAAVMPGIGWIVAVVVLNYSRGGDVVVPGKLAVDPGIGVVGSLFFLSGLVGTLVAGVLAGRKLRRRPPSPPSGS